MTHQYPGASEKKYKQSTITVEKTQLNITQLLLLLLALS